VREEPASKQRIAAQVFGNHPADRQGRRFRKRMAKLLILSGALPLHVIVSTLSAIETLRKIARGWTRQSLGRANPRPTGSGIVPAVTADMRIPILLSTAVALVASMATGCTGQVTAERAYAPAPPSPARREVRP
jgi:hypothetical protein